MKKINLFKQMGFVSLLLFVAAIVFGADTAMAMAVTDDTADNAGAVVDDKGINSNLNGTAASATQIRDGELAEPEIDTFVAHFRPYMFAADTDMRKRAKLRTVKSYEVEHYSAGSAILNCTLGAAVSKATSITLTVGTHISKDDLKMFAPYSTVNVPEVNGYADDGSTVEGTLMLFVTSRTDTTATLEAINPLIENNTSKVPAIPNGSTLVVCANACSESQMQVSPENYQPRPKTVYLQKKIVNIVITDHFKDIVKKVPFFEQDVKDDALYNFRRKSARTLWIGKATKIKKDVGNNMGEEYIYTSEGILRQIQSMYAIDNDLKFEDLIGICKMQFTEFSESNEAEVYCGKNFMERLLNIDFTKHKDISFTAHQDIGIDIRSFQTTFGKLNFKHEYTLDDLGYSDAAAVIDMTHAVRYLKVDDQEHSVDMKTGAGENREAKRDIHIQIDALALKGYNSILVAPANVLFRYADSDRKVTITSLATVDPSSNGYPFTNTLTDGTLVYLTADDNYSKYSANTLIVYNASSESWVAYNGTIYA